MGLQEAAPCPARSVPVLKGGAGRLNGSVTSACQQEPDQPDPSTRLSKPSWHCDRLVWAPKHGSYADSSLREVRPFQVLMHIGTCKPLVFGCPA